MPGQPSNLEEGFFPVIWVQLPKKGFNIDPPSVKLFFQNRNQGGYGNPSISNLTEEEEDEEEENEDEEEEERKAANIKSNNPHLAGGESPMYSRMNCLIENEYIKGTFPPQKKTPMYSRMNCLIENEYIKGTFPPKKNTYVLTNELPN